MAVQGFFEAGLHRRVRDVGGFAGAPFNRQFAQAFHRLVSGLRHHGHGSGAAIQLGHGQHFCHARHAFDLGVVKALERAAHLRVHAHACVVQAGQTHIRSEDGAAIDFGDGFQARQRTANQVELVGCFERDGFGSGLCGGEGGELTEAGRFA